MQPNIQDIVGKTIDGVVVKVRPQGTLKLLVFLTFTDGTMFEFYSGAWFDGAGPRPGGRQEAREYLAKGTLETIEYGFNDSEDPRQ